MTRFYGECTPAEAATILRVHHRTVLKWIHRIEANEPSPIPAEAVRKNGITGYYYLREREIRKIATDYGM